MVSTATGSQIFIQIDLLFWSILRFSGLYVTYAFQNDTCAFKKRSKHKQILGLLYDLLVSMVIEIFYKTCPTLV